MKKVIAIRFVSTISALLAISFLVILGSKWIAQTHLTERTETEHFVILWSAEDAQFFDCLPKGIEKKYQHIASDLNSTVAGKISIKLYDNFWVYNLSIGNPFPFPKLRSTGNADYRKREIDILLPPIQDPVYQEKNVRSMICQGLGVGHEVTHILLSEINPSFIRGWWHEGIAYFEDYAHSDGNEAFQKEKEKITQAVNEKVAAGDIPLFTDLSICTKDFNKFFGMKGYEFSYTFVDFVVAEYGIGVLNRMAQHPDDYERVFHTPRDEVWQQWKTFLMKYYSR